MLSVGQAVSYVYCQLTELRTPLRAESSSSIRVFSCIRSSIDSLEKSRGTPPDVGPEGIVGVWMLSSMGMPILKERKDHPELNSAELSGIEEEDVEMVDDWRTGSGAHDFLACRV